MCPAPARSFEGDGTLVIGYLPVVKFPIEDVLPQRHEMQSGTGEPCMFLLAGLTSDCFIFIDDYLSSIP